MSIENYGESRRRYRQHKKRSRRRGIPWHFNYITWLRKWSESGKWRKRGTRKGQYVMARPGDRGPYSPNNVRICTVEENHKERKLSLEAWRRISKSMIGNKRGVGNKNRLGKRLSPKSRRLISLAASENTKIRKRNSSGQFIQ